MEAGKSIRLFKFAGIAVAIWGLMTAADIVAMSSHQRLVPWLSLLCGFSFLGFCMTSYLRHPHRSTQVLALVGLGCSLIFFTGPGFESQLLGAVFSIIRSGLVLVGFAAMLHFLLLFPEPGSFSGSSRKTRALYVPAFLFWLLLSYRALFPSETETVLDTFAYVMTGLIMTGYLLAGLIVFLRRYIRTAKELRGSNGLRLMLWGSLVGFMPALIGFLPALSSVPGTDTYFISLAILPLVWSRAIAMAWVEKYS